MSTPHAPFRIAILDLYQGETNQGMRCIRELVERADGRWGGRAVVYDVFDVRSRGEVPGLDYDAYLSSGGPGSPFDGAGTAWERDYFAWVDALWAHNRAADAPLRKHALFICHSFQMLARHFGLGQVTARHSASFGVFPVHKTASGRADAWLADLDDPFYAADFRSYQLVRPDRARLRALGARILAIEKARPHVARERAVMAIRLSAEILATQFHPEADPAGMARHFRDDVRRASVIEKHGSEKYYRILHRLEEPAYLKRTHDALLPGWLQAAILAQAPVAPPETTPT